MKSAPNLYQAIAETNQVFVVQANSGTGIFLDKSTYHRGTFAGTHGQSQVLDPQGRRVAQAPILGEHIVLADLDLGLVNMTCNPWVAASSLLSRLDLPC